MTVRTDRNIQGIKKRAEPSDYTPLTRLKKELNSRNTGKAEVFDIVSTHKHLRWGFDATNNDHKYN